MKIKQRNERENIASQLWILKFSFIFEVVVKFLGTREKWNNPFENLI